MPNTKVYTIQAEWDNEAHCWVASSEDVPGLATGAESLDALVHKLRVVVPELLYENGLLADEMFQVPFSLIAHHAERAPDAA